MLAGKYRISSKALSHAQPWLVRMALSILLCLLPAVMVQGGLTPSEEEIAVIARQHGSAAAGRMQQWREILLSDKNTEEIKKLEMVNRFFNRLPFVSDLEHWGKIDYWATPTEFLVSNGGDCEEFAIAKYFTLRELGVPAERLRITYVKALSLNQAHMVLTYFSTPSAEPLVLDNLQGQILPASQRADLVPVYSFNGESLWLAKELSGRGQLVGGSGRIGLWQDLLARMKRESDNRH